MRSRAAPASSRGRGGWEGFAPLPARSVARHRGIDGQAQGLAPAHQVGELGGLEPGAQRTVRVKRRVWSSLLGASQGRLFTNTSVAWPAATAWNSKISLAELPGSGLAASSP